MRTLRRLAGDPQRWIRLREWERATLRWAWHNSAARVSGCQCGQPATVCTYDGEVEGGAAAETWTCAAHVGVTSWTQVDGRWIPDVAEP